MSATLKYVIRYVSDMDTAVRFFVDNLGLRVRFQSPHWTELESGETTLALHPATASKPAGSSELGFNAADIDALYAKCLEGGAPGVEAPKNLHGVRMAKVRGTDGEEITLSSPE